MNDGSTAPRKSGTTFFVLVVGLAIAAGLGVLLQRQLASRAPAEVAAVTPAPGAPPRTAEAGAPATDSRGDQGSRGSAAVRAHGSRRQDADARRLERPAADRQLLGHVVPALRAGNSAAVAAAARTQAEKLEVIGIAVDFREDVLKFADERKLDYPLLIGEEDGLAAVTAVGMTAAFPFTLFADSQQRIIALKVGELHHDEATLILDRVAAVDAGKLDLATARAEISTGLKDLATQRGIAEAAASAAGSPNKT